MTTQKVVKFVGFALLGYVAVQAVFAVVGFGAVAALGARRTEPALEEGRLVAL